MFESHRVRGFLTCRATCYGIATGRAEPLVSPARSLCSGAAVHYLPVGPTLQLSAHACPAKHRPNKHAQSHTIYLCIHTHLHYIERMYWVPARFGGLALPVRTTQQPTCVAPTLTLRGINLCSTPHTLPWASIRAQIKPLAHQDPLVGRPPCKQVVLLPLPPVVP